MNMQKWSKAVVAIAIAGMTLVVAPLFAMEMKTEESGKTMKAKEKMALDTDKMSKEALIKLAQSAAPTSISKGATIAVLKGGKPVEIQKGSNGFTCLPVIDNIPGYPDPACIDAAGMQWLTDALAGAPKPTNTVPGIGYMAHGGAHFEKDGKILMGAEPGVTVVPEPAHWMLFSPFDPKATGISSLPDKKFGTYIMFNGTPYSHLMIIQDPMKLK